jgi:hypothetical protein
MLNRQSPGNRRLCHDFDVSLRRSSGLGSFLDRSKWSLPSGTPLYTVYPIAVGRFTNAQIDLELCRVPETGDSAMTLPKCKRTRQFFGSVQAESPASGTPALHCITCPSGVSPLGLRSTLYTLSLLGDLQMHRSILSYAESRRPETLL